MKRHAVIDTLIALALLTGLVLCAWVGAQRSTYEPIPTERPAVTIPCMEDEPCWDCRTMGNRDCGPDHYAP